MAIYISRLMHDSEQEEAGRMRRTSELFTGSTALKFVNALNKPPLKLSLSSACSNHIELATQQWRKSAPCNPEYQPFIPWH